MRFYRALLHLYPASFRMEYGDEMTALYRRRAAQATGLRRVALWIDAVFDIVPNAALTHWDILRQDLRYTARALRRSIGFAVTAVLIVALGVGANTAAFSIADFVLIRPLPFPEPDNLVKLWQQTPGYATMELSPGNYRDWKSMSRSFASMGAFNTTTMNLVGQGEPLRLTAATVTHDVLPTLGVAPMIGRGFDSRDSIADEQSVLVSYGLWQGVLGGTPEVLGKTLQIDGRPRAIIGVMAPDFRFPNRTTQVWTPLWFDEGDFEERGNNYLRVIARLAPGVTQEQASADLAGVTAELERRFPRENEKTGANLYPLAEEFSAQTKVLILALCGAALCILLLACANLANLLLARAVSREREMAVRAAMGAGRERLVRQMITESVTLAILGGLVGIVVAIVAVPLLSYLVPASLPIGERPAVDLRILGFAALLTAVTGVAFGVIPALKASGITGTNALRNGVRAGGGRRQRARAALVMVEVTASMVLIIASGLLIRAVSRVNAVDPGFRTEGVLTLRNELAWPTYASVERRAQYYNRVLSDVRALPGVTSAAFTSFLPMTMTGGIWPVGLTGQAMVRAADRSASLRFITPGYFETLGVPILKGRGLTETDDGKQPFVAVVSESFVARHFPNEDGIGRSFNFAFSERTIVGIAANVRVRGLERESEPQVYLPYRQVVDSQFYFYAPKDLAVRSTVPPASLVPAIRALIRAADPEQPVTSVSTMEDIVAQQTAARRAQLNVLSVLAAIALLLAGVGIHGLLSFTVSSRSQEIGVRRALGARSGSIVRMILKEGTILALAGVVPGVVLAFLAGRGMEALLAGVQPGDPATFAVAVALCLVMTIAGCLLPAWRAVRVNPIAVMRSE